MGGGRLGARIGGAPDICLILIISYLFKDFRVVDAVHGLSFEELSQAINTGRRVFVRCQIVTVLGDQEGSCDCVE